jgi:diamine N-acetyltransferase
MPSNADAKVTLREITQETLFAILSLEVSDDQKRFVAPNAVSIAEAYFSEHAWFRAIYAGDTPVGFVMLYSDWDEPKYFLWRFMIDKQYQRQGYGSLAMQELIAHVRSRPNAKELLVSYAPGEGNPSPFYEKCGFVETGEWEDDEKVMKLTWR